MTKTWYLCDPEKNTGCKKTNCAYNPKAKYRVCISTSKKEFARLDFTGQPCENYEHNKKMREIRNGLLASALKPFH